ncbi:hypothetical protein R3W88_017995 [Solanum pinnatisectum]|uniref:Uncharacterized protein n=1 Tax=Solanum pinnatisectum TaxID=50273 RepID=A0AAV9L2U8_9SOLN|nr:hypothetical protein R3W88_017995 [Solanum pinnatisectum]
MGACASRPKDLDRDFAPAPVPAEESVTPKADAVPQEKKDGEETKKEEPLIDVSTEATKIEEVSTETKAGVEAEKETAEEVKVEAVKEEPKEQQPAEEKKEAETVAQ